jgi:hypothetical protein
MAAAFFFSIGLKRTLSRKPKDGTHWTVREAAP